MMTIFLSCRLRVNCVGVFDVLTFDNSQTNHLALMPQYQVLLMMLPVCGPLWLNLFLKWEVLTYVYSCMCFLSCSKQTWCRWARWCWHWHVTPWLAFKGKTFRRPWNWCLSTTLQTSRTSFCKKGRGVWHKAACFVHISHWLDTL